MKTPRKSELDAEIKQVFKELFEIQHRLERYADGSNLHMKSIILSIDQSLETLLRFDHD